MTPNNLLPAPLDLDALELKAKAAQKETPGPWGFARADWNSGTRPWVCGTPDGSATGAAVCTVQPPEGAHGLGNQPFPTNHPIYTTARYVAACDPDTVLELIRLARRATE